MSMEQPRKRARLMSREELVADNTVQQQPQRIEVVVQEPQDAVQAHHDVGPAEMFEHPRRRRTEHMKRHSRHSSSTTHSDPVDSQSLEPRQVDVAAPPLIDASAAVGITPPNQATLPAVVPTSLGADLAVGSAGNPVTQPAFEPASAPRAEQPESPPSAQAVPEPAAPAAAPPPNDAIVPQAPVNPAIPQSPPPAPAPQPAPNPAPQSTAEPAAAAPTQDSGPPVYSSSALSPPPQNTPAPQSPLPGTPEPASSLVPPVSGSTTSSSQSGSTFTSPSPSGPPAYSNTASSDSSANSTSFSGSTSATSNLLSLVGSAVGSSNSTSSPTTSTLSLTPSGPTPLTPSSFRSPTASNNSPLSVSAFSIGPLFTYSASTSGFGTLSPGVSTASRSTTFMTSSTPTSSSFPSSISSVPSESSSFFSESSSVFLSSGPPGTGAGGVGYGTAAPGSSATSSGSASQGQNSGGGSGAVPTPQVVGGVVGGLAGLSLLLIAALLFLRWYKKNRAAALGAVGAGGDSDSTRPETRENPSQSAAIAAAVPSGAAAGGLMSRLSRPRPAPPPPTGERGFERVAGRKLPSQFSPGVEGPTGPTTSSGVGSSAAAAGGLGVAGAGAAAAGARYPSDNSSHYPSGGTWLSTGSAQNPFKDPGPRSPVPVTGAAAAAAAREEASSPSERERFMPGPARTPTLHQGETSRTSHNALEEALRGPVPAVGSPPGRHMTPPPSRRGRPSMNRSPGSFDSSRGSRFTEDFV